MAAAEEEEVPGVAKLGLLQVAMLAARTVRRRVRQAAVAAAAARLAGAQGEAHRTEAEVAVMVSLLLEPLLLEDVAVRRTRGALLPAAVAAVAAAAAAAVGAAGAHMRTVGAHPDLAAAAAAAATAAEAVARRRRDRRQAPWRRQIRSAQSVHDRTNRVQRDRMAARSRSKLLELMVTTAVTPVVLVAVQGRRPDPRPDQNPDRKLAMAMVEGHKLEAARRPARRQAQARDSMEGRRQAPRQALMAMVVAAAATETMG